MQAKPDCTGQRFGMLLVLGRGGKKLRPRTNRKSTYESLWLLRCDCGEVIEKPRVDFESKGQVSCGCKRKQGLVDNKRRPIDITGCQFGTLTAVALSGNKIRDKPAWLMRCNCGQVIEKTLSDIRRCEYYKTRINCGDRDKHPERWLKYPPIPPTYPAEAGKVLAKHLPLVTPTSAKKQVCDEVVDEQRDRLIRIAFIIAWRRASGEEITESHESNLIRKHLRYCSIDVYRKRYNRGMTTKVGATMTNSTSNDYPVIEAQGIKFVPKKIKFSRR